jgi:hypothetical protein
MLAKVKVITGNKINLQDVSSYSLFWICLDGEEMENNSLLRALFDYFIFHPHSTKKSCGLDA